MWWNCLIRLSKLQIRGEAQEQEGGLHGFELWEAHRDGKIGVREVLYPLELNGEHTARSLALPDGRLGLVIAEPNTMGSPADRYYAARDADGTWGMSVLLDQ